MCCRDDSHVCSYIFCRETPAAGSVWLILLALLFAPHAAAAPDQTIGWLEYVHIGGADLRLEAKIDTGADITSLHARNIRVIKVKGENWLQFRLYDIRGHSVTLKRRIVRYAKIKQKSALSTKRPVIKLGICLGHTFREVEVNLAKRGNFKYPVLIGRNYLKGNFVVDPGAKHMTSPSCPGINGD